MNRRSVTASGQGSDIYHPARYTCREHVSCALSRQSSTGRESSGDLCPAANVLSQHCCTPSLPRALNCLPSKGTCVRCGQHVRDNIPLPREAMLARELLLRPFDFHQWHGERTNSRIISRVLQADIGVFNPSDVCLQGSTLAWHFLSSCLQELGFPSGSPFPFPVWAEQTRGICHQSGWEGAGSPGGAG